MTTGEAPLPIPPLFVWVGFPPFLGPERMDEGFDSPSEPLAESLPEPYSVAVTRAAAIVTLEADGGLPAVAARVLSLSDCFSGV